MSVVRTMQMHYIEKLKLFNYCIIICVRFEFQYFSKIDTISIYIISEKSWVQLVQYC